MTIRAHTGNFAASEEVLLNIHSVVLSDVPALQADAGCTAFLASKRTSGCEVARW